MAKKTGSEGQLHKVGDMTVGVVPREKIHFRRDNYRRMSELQRQTLKASVDKFGFQSFLIVKEDGDGYGLVDGHHRLQELDERGVTSVPILVLPANVDENDATLGMLSFNVSAEVVDDQLVKLLTELQEAGITNAEIAAHATLSERFVDQLQEALKNTPTPESGETELSLEGEGGGKSRKKKSPDVKLVILSTNDESSETLGFFTMPTKAIIDNAYREALRESNLVLEEIPLEFVEDTNELSNAIDMVLRSIEEENKQA